MPGEVNYGSLPFEEQIDYFRNKLNVPTERWADVWKNAHDRSFMVAGAMKDDLLADFRAAVDTAISEGKSLNWFQSQFKTIVNKHGWEHTGNADWRSKVIYETNMRQSYSAGREQQIEQVKSRRPYGIYKHSGSEHPRLDHLSWNNLVLPLDDPWWETHTPTNGWGCKCKKLTANQRTLDRLGLEVSESPTIEYVDYIDKVTGEVHQVPKGISPGFDYTPRTSGELTERTKQTLDEKPPLADRLTPRTVDHAFSTIKGVNAKSLSQVLDGFDGPERELLAAFLQENDIKTLFLKSSEIGGKSYKSLDIAKDVEDYLQSGRPSLLNYYHRQPTRTNGFTATNWNHVVVKAKGTDSLNKLTATQLGEAIERAIDERGLERWWSFSQSAKVMYGEAARVAVTWAHEIGHQVYFKAGQPDITKLFELASLTQYGRSNPQEWFSEHFIAWLYAPAALKRELPDVYTAITNIVTSTIVK